MFAPFSKWFSTVWIVFVYILPGSFGVLLSWLIFAGVAFGLEFAEVSVVVVTGNATLRRVAEALYQGQQPPFSSAPVFLSPTNAAIIGVIGTPVFFIVDIMGEFIWKILSDEGENSEDDKEADSFFARVLRNATAWPLFSLVLGVTVGAMILRFRDPAISVWYSALCGGAGMLVLIVPLVLFSELKRILVLEMLSAACLYVAERFAAHAWKGYDRWDVAAEGKIAL